MHRGPKINKDFCCTVFKWWHNGGVNETPNKPNKNMSPKLPTTVAQILAIANPMFADPAVHSVNVLATFGEVTVSRDGTVRLA